MFLNHLIAGYLNSVCNQNCIDDFLKRVSSQQKPFCSGLCGQIQWIARATWRSNRFKVFQGNHQAATCSPAHTDWSSCFRNIVAKLNRELVDDQSIKAHIFVLVLDGGTAGRGIIGRGSLQNAWVHGALLFLCCMWWGILWEVLTWVTENWFENSTVRKQIKALPVQMPVVRYRHLFSLTLCYCI